VCVINKLIHYKEIRRVKCSYPRANVGTRVSGFELFLLRVKCPFSDPGGLCYHPGGRGAWAGARFGSPGHCEVGACEYGWGVDRRTDNRSGPKRAAATRSGLDRGCQTFLPILPSVSLVGSGSLTKDESGG